MLTPEFKFFYQNIIMKNILLLTLPLMLTACAYDVQHYIPSMPYGVNAPPAPYSHHPNNNYQQPYYNNQPQQQQQQQQSHHQHQNNQNYNEHHDNGKHKGQYKNKHHDDD
jgi:hypothetical protein